MEFELWYLVIVPVLFLAGWFCRGVDNRQQAAERSPEAYYKGINLLLNDQADKALDTVIDVVKLDPETTELHHTLGNLFCRRGEFARAVRVHNHLYNREDLPAAERSLALSELANDYLKAGIYDRAEESFKRLSQVPEYRLQALHQLLGIYCTEKEWLQAIDLARALEREAGENRAAEIAHFYCELSQRAQRMKNIEAAQEYLNKALEADPACVRALIAMGYLAMTAQKPKAALEAWLRVEDLSPNHMSLLMAPMAQAYEALGQQDEALRLLKRALSKHPTPELLTLTFETVLKVEGDDAARALLVEELRRHPSLGAYEKLLVLRLKDNPEDEDGVLLQGLLKPYVSRQGRYQCSHCGFRLKGYQWHCPGCSSWGSYPPVRIDN